MDEARSSVDPEEIAKFTRLAAEWWDPNGKFRPLHQFNPVRLGFIRAMAAAHFHKTFGEVSGGEHGEFLSRLNEIGQRRFHTGAAGA